MQTPRGRLRFFVAGTFVLLLIAASVGASDADLVMFNTQSLKYHCITCTWAKKCTKNCVKITKAAAKAKGGVACKVCKGSCS